MKVSPKANTLSKRSLRSECGQMAIFVALIFQILFVFFAMAINVGLVVHDKINLQNSVDLAAYYAAQRQAEWLNVIAHQNYQIRQSFKVLSWRYRVLGTMGRSNHPSKGSGVGTDAPYADAEDPTFCVAYKPNFIGVQGDDNICKDQSLNVPAIDLPIGFGPINAALSIFTAKINDQIQALCSNYGGIHYFYVNAIRYAYQMDQFRNKQIIYKIAENMGKPFNQMIDLNGDPVLQGAQNTFVKNLTWENRNNVESFQVLNSIEQPPFNTPSAWLNELRIRVQMYYRDVNTSGGCFSNNVLATTTPTEASTANSYLQQQAGMSLAEAKSKFVETPPNSPESLSIGFEKNPWVKLYVKVKAKTRPRQIFFPLGDRISMEATAYAQPFGGAIGPWYHMTWQREAAQSGPSSELDPLVPPLIISSAGAISPGSNDKLKPNYSRYPGDTVGLKSTLAQQIPGGAQIVASFRSILGALEYGPSEVPDPLSWMPGEAINVRKYEVAAAAPDLFDIAYYSIEPNWGRTYLPKLKNVAVKLGLPSGAKLRPDLGGREDVSQLQDFSVVDQMEVAAGLKPYDSSAPAQTFHGPNQYWYVRDRAHLLTSWVHSDIIAEYQQFPEARFGKCEVWDDGFKERIPGSCLKGGRTGYSVKIVSGKFLRGPARYGGPGVSDDTSKNNPDVLGW